MGSLLFLIFPYFFKLYIYALSGEQTSIILIALFDFIYITLIISLFSLVISLRFELIKTLLIIAIIYSSVFYLIDVGVLFYTGFHLRHDLLIKYITEISLVFSSIPILVSLIFIASVSFFILKPSYFLLFSLDRRVILLLVTMICFRLVIVNLIPIPQGAFILNQMFFELSYSSSEDTYANSFKKESYKNLLEDSFIDIPNSKPNIIILVVESLSSFDSLRSGGRENRLSKLDELTKKGIIFRNFFANSYDSESAFVSMLCQIPPLLYPNSPISPFVSHPCFLHNSITQFNSAGYNTGFLMLAPLSSFGWGDYMKSIGFKEVLGRDEVESFIKAPRFVFDSPPDEFLYEEILKRFDSGELNNPFFQILFTISSHFPYKHPKDNTNTYESILKYVEDQVIWFFDELNKRKFFENGILLIVGDHRKMLSISKEEHEHYGISSQARTFLAAIGKDISENLIDDRLIQQSDLLKNIFNLRNTEKNISEKVLFPLRRNYSSYLSSSLSSILILTKEGLETNSAYITDFNHGIIKWREMMPLNYYEFEKEIHQIRAAGQYLLSLRDHSSWCRTFSINSFKHKYPVSVNLVENISLQERSKKIFMTGLENFNINYTLFNNILSQSMNPNDAVVVLNQNIQLEKKIKRYLRLKGESEACLFVDGVLYASIYPKNEGKENVSNQELWLDSGEHSIQLVIKKINPNSFTRAEHYTFLDLKGDVLGSFF